MSGEWVTCGDAYAKLKSRFDTLHPQTIRKALIGMILEAGLPVICKEFTESALAYLPQGISKSVDPWGAGCFTDNSPPIDFWRYDMVVKNAELSFSTGMFAVKRHLNAADLPYRFFKTNYVSDVIEAELTQIAHGISFFRSDLEALVSDRRWSVVWAKKAEPKAPGRVKSWQWDRVKASLTVHVAGNPALLNSSPTELMRYMTDLFEGFHGGRGNAPDKRDIYAYVQLILGQCCADDYPPD